MNTESLKKLKPYTMGKSGNNGMVDIYFDSEGLFTVPKNSASAIIDMLNEAFSRGVKMTLLNTTTTKSNFVDVLKNNITPPVKPSVMPQEDATPINNYKPKR